jgi:hypothetical protein
LLGLIAKYNIKRWWTVEDCFRLSLRIVYGHGRMGFGVALDSLHYCMISVFAMVLEDCEWMWKKGFRYLWSLVISVPWWILFGINSVQIRLITWNGRSLHCSFLGLQTSVQSEVVKITHGCHQQ